MKAPDKIYTTPVGTFDTKPVPDLQDNIYIRKDYLLEKIRKTAIWNTIKVGGKEIRDIVTKIIESI